MTFFSYNSNCDHDTDLSPVMLKHKLIQDIAILNICMKLYQNQPINERIRVLTTFS